MGKGQQVNPFGIGGAFVQYCLDQGILYLEMEENHEIKYYLTDQGERLLKENFGIVLSECAKINRKEG